MRGRLSRKYYFRKLHCMIVLQAVSRQMKQRLKYQRIRKVMIRLQATMRAYLGRKHYLIKKKAATSIQSVNNNITHLNNNDNNELIIFIIVSSLFR